MQGSATWGTKMEGLERWQGKVALVTGASSGIGMAIAKVLARAGLRVVLAGRRAERLERVARDIAGQGGEALPVSADLRKEDAIRAMFQAVRRAWGGLDVLVNNAGMGYRSEFSTTDAADWREVLDVNVLALSICIREALEDMKGKQDAAIINISSLAGHRVPPGGRGFTFYAASKHAVRAITEGLRDELAAKGVHIKLGTVSPGTVETEFQQVATKVGAKPLKYADFRVLDPEDVAQAALFMLSTPRHVQISDIAMRSVEQPH